MAVSGPITLTPSAQSSDLQWAIAQVQGQVASIATILALITEADGEKLKLVEALSGVELLVDSVASALEGLAMAARMAPRR